MNLKEISIFELIPFYLGPLRGAHTFLHSSSIPSIYSAQTSQRSIMLHINLFFLQNKEVFIEFDSSHQSYQLGKLNDPLTSLSCLMKIHIQEAKGVVDIGDERRSWTIQFAFSFFTFPQPILKSSKPIFLQLTSLSRIMKWEC